MLRSAVFAKYPGSLISKSYDQNKFSCFPLINHSKKHSFFFIYSAKNESLNLDFFRGSVFDLSHMKCVFLAKMSDFDDFSTFEMNIFNEVE